MLDILSYYSAAARTLEAHRLATLLAKILRGRGRVVVMGDFNTLSPLDALQHEAAGVAALLSRTDHSVFERLRKKFLRTIGSNYNESSDPGDSSRFSAAAAGQQIDYVPMQTLLSAGMHDACLARCSGPHSVYISGICSAPTANTPVTFPPLWTMNGTDPVSKCMRETCGYTEPTEYNPEVGR